MSSNLMNDGTMSRLVTCGVLGALILANAGGGGCARAPLQSPQNAMRETSAPEINDDLPLDPLLKAVESQIRFLETSPIHSDFVFGPDHFSKAEYLAGLRRFFDLGKTASSPKEFYKTIQSEFNFYEVYGQGKWSQVFITSYFEPVIQGSLKKTEKFSTPLYQAPHDLITIDLARFDPKYEPERKFRGRIKDNTLVPYFTRNEIDSQKSLQGRKIELCWVDPLDAFFLQIQGSGTVDLGRGKKLYINYANQNGFRYEAIGKFLKDFIPLDQMNLFTIESYLRTLPKNRLQETLNKNPSYVFFQTAQQHAITYLGVPATEGRTIATDKRYFPKGALALLAFDKPVFQPDSSLPLSSQPVSRFVLDQDIGGAITGGGRVDLFWGQGNESKRYAGVMKNFGSLYYIAPKRNPR